MKEEQIAQFLRVNAGRLYPTLYSPPFFAGRNWEQIYSALTESLMVEIDAQLKPALRLAVSDTLDLSFIQFVRQQNMPQSQIKEALYEFLVDMLSYPEARRELVGPLNAIHYRYVGRYLDDVFTRNEYLHFELTKVQRLRMGKEEIRNFICTSLLLRPAYRFRGPANGEAGYSATGTVQTVFLEKALEMLRERLPAIPEEVLRSALYGNASFLENPKLPATSRISAVFSALCRNARPHERVDRGADTADKSWLSIARRNYRLYGYDVKLLDEFYKIAAENGW